MSAASQLFSLITSLTSNWPNKDTIERVDCTSADQFYQRALYEAFALCHLWIGLIIPDLKIHVGILLGNWGD